MVVDIDINFVTSYTCMLQTYDVDIEQAVSEDKQAEPYIAVTGMPGAESTQYFTICENAILLESKSLHDAFVDFDCQLLYL